MNDMKPPAIEPVKTLEQFEDVPPVRETKPPPNLRAPELRKLAFGSKAAKWKHELIEWNGQTILVRAPTVAAMKKIMGHMPPQKVSATTSEDAEAQLKEATLSIDMSVTYDMKIERVIQCAHDSFGQRLFGDEDRAELEQLAADDELLEKVNAAVERLTKEQRAQGEGSGGTGSA